jgi:hypothetical protein
VASATPYRPYGGGRSHPRPLGVVRPPQKAKKKKKGKWGFGLWGWPDHLLGPGGGFGHHLPVVGGGRKPPPGPWGWSGHPQNPKPIFAFFFFFFLAFRGGRTTPKGLGWLRPPLGQKWGGPATPIFWARGGSSHPDFFLFFFFFFFFFFFLIFIISFFKKKKKKKNLKYPKLRRFGQNDVVLK